jgi:parallel beta-helix repeat protein
MLACARTLLVCAMVATTSVAAVHGARCTHTLSPGADVQRALNALPAEHRAVLCLRAGEFRLPTYVSVRRDAVTIRGAGPSTVLRLDEGAETPVMVVGDDARRVPRRPVSDVTIERLRIVGGGPGGSEHCRPYPYITNSAVVVRAGRRIALRRLEVAGCRSACILTEHGSRDVVIEDDDVSGSVWDGISLNRTADARIVGNRIHNNIACGITTEHLESSLIANNVVTANKTHGLYLSDSYHNVVRGNSFVDNVLSGVFVTCAVRDREPAVLCWKDSMSADNRFESNVFAGNRLAFMVGADRAANCARPGFVPNRSRGDIVSQRVADDDPSATCGRCIVRDTATSGPSHGRRSRRATHPVP